MKIGNSIFVALAMVGMASADVLTFPYGNALDHTSFKTTSKTSVANTTVNIDPGVGMPQPDNLARLDIGETEFTAIDSEDFNEVVRAIEGNSQAMLTMVSTENSGIVSYSWRGFSSSGWITLTGVGANPVIHWDVRIEFDYSLGEGNRRIRYLVRETGSGQDYTALVPETGSSDGWMSSGYRASSKINSVSVMGLGSVCNTVVNSGKRAATATITTEEQYGFSYSNLNIKVTADGVWGVDKATIVVKNAQGADVWASTPIDLISSGTGTYTNTIDLTGHVESGKIYTYEVLLKGTEETITNNATKITLATVKGWYGFNNGAFYDAATNGVFVNTSSSPVTFSTVDEDVCGTVMPTNASPNNAYTTVDTSINVESATSPSSVEDLEGIQGALMLADTGSGRSWACWSDGNWICLSNANVGTANGSYATKAEFDYAAKKVRYSIGGYVLSSSNGTEWFDLPEAAVKLSQTEFLGEGSVSELTATYMTSDPQDKVVAEGSTIRIDSNVDIDLDKNANLAAGTYKLDNPNGKKFRVRWTDGNGKYATMVNGQLKVMSGSPANGLSSFDSYVLGLDATSASSKPIVKTEQNSGDSTMTLTIPGIAPKSVNETGVEVKYQLKTSATPVGLSATGAIVDEPTFEVGLPESGVIYYGVDIKLDAK